MITQSETGKKSKHGAVWLWCIGEGYEEQDNHESFLDATFSKEGNTTGFIFAFNKTVDELLSCIEKAKEKVQYVYVVIDDNSKYQSFRKILPEFCGIFCNSNAFGLGMTTQILQKPENECESRNRHTIPYSKDLWI